jgi:beta-lactamase class A
MKRRLFVLIMSLLLVACQAGTPTEADIQTEAAAAEAAETAVSPTPSPQPTAALTAVPSLAEPETTPTSRPAPFTPADIGYLAAAIEATLTDFDGLSSYVVVDLKRGDRLDHNADLAISGMSLLKIPIVVQTYRHLTTPPDLEQTKLITQTVSMSSNYSANLLMAMMAGTRNTYTAVTYFNEQMGQLGLYNTFITVPFDSDPRPEQLTTYLTPANRRPGPSARPDPYRQTSVSDLTTLLAWVYECARSDSGPLRQHYPDDLSQAECAAILEVMQLNELSNLLSEGLPPGTPISHKVGWVGTTHGDIAIVYGPEQDYLLGLVLYGDTWLEWDKSAPLFEAISQLAYRHFNDPDAYSAEVLAAPPAVSSTPTPLATPDLPQALVFGTQGIGLKLRATPGGAELLVLPEGSLVGLLPTAPAEQGGVTWRQVRTAEGQEGWVGAAYLISE